MNAEAIREWIDRRPFQPFVVKLAGGETHQVRHPESVILMRTTLAIAYPETDRLAVCSLPHITNIETPQPA
ncbi:MAG TPA: hypothetical protein VFI31_16895 [Pirellulales bacterium]|nr:hypothetical protein [Pirellulales bacterium]